MAKDEEEKQKAPQQGEKQKAVSIVRIAGRDINGDYDIPAALREIRGIGYNMANALSISISNMYKIDKSTKIGALEESDIEKIEDLLKDPKKANLPLYLLNRRKDRETGEDTHLVGTDLMVRVRQDIENDIKTQTWRGFRHRYGQKVRGQRTRSTGRTGATVGVTKKAAEEAQKAAQKTTKPGAAGAAAAQPAAAAPAAEKK